MNNDHLLGLLMICMTVLFAIAIARYPVAASGTTKDHVSITIDCPNDKITLCNRMMEAARDIARAEKKND